MANVEFRTIAPLAAALAAGQVTSRELVDRCLAHIAAPDGQGARAFLKVHAQQARASAEFCDQARARGTPLPAFAGIPISVKDLFDVAGDVTTAGSVLLRAAPAASHDATAVARLKAAGFIVIGRTNMTEFAYSGLGVNPHYGTPLNAWARAAALIPGGSSAGAAVSITDGMAFGALGTDTGGSCRIPAALCGIVGFKPTAARVPLSGAYPLSPTLDSIGPLANSVACCTILDAVLSGEFPSDRGIPAIGHLRLGVLRSYVMEGVDAQVAAAYEKTLRKLANAGARLSDVALPELGELPEINHKGGIAAAEAYAWHRELIPKHAAQYDPRVLSRIRRGGEQDTADVIELHRRRAELIARVAPQVAPFDALLMPTVPIIAPALSELAADDAYARINALVLRNPSTVNFLDGCAISIPCHEPGTAPVGLTLFGLRNSDRHLLAVAAAAELSLL
jgi:aspartyl-tRNA(Asn)/glutamyl-tRNA(Gln) amidotransferase subunit A